MKKIALFLMVALVAFASCNKSSESSAAASADVEASAETDSINLPERPSPAKFVNDFAGLLKADQVQALEDTLRAYTKETTNQIAVVTTDDLDGCEVLKWGIGQKGLNNGVLIVLFPKTKEHRGEVAIVPGKGLEHALSGELCEKIMEEEMIPLLKENNDYTAAVWAAIKAIMPACAK